MQDKQDEIDWASFTALISERILIAVVAIAFGAIFGPIIEYSLEDQAVQTMALDSNSDGR